MVLGKDCEAKNTLHDTLRTLTHAQELPAQEPEGVVGWGHMVREGGGTAEPFV